MYEVIFSDEFKKQLSKIKNKNPLMFKRVEKKIKQILLEPVHLKHLRNVLKGEQRVHLGPFVLRFQVKENRVYFITLRHHDSAY